MKGLPGKTQLKRMLQEMRGRTNEDGIYMLHDHMTVATNMEVDETLGIMEDDPQNYCEARQVYDAEKWKKSYDDELRSIYCHNVWTLMSQSEVPIGHHVLGCHTVFLQKHDKNNIFSQHKIRIVMKGFSQVEGIDYKETFAPVG